MYWITAYEYFFNFYVEKLAIQKFTLTFATNIMRYLLIDTNIFVYMVRDQRFMFYKNRGLTSFLMKNKFCFYTYKR